MNKLARPWAEEMAFRMNARGYEKSNPAGKLMMDIGLPLCRKIAKVQSNKKMHILPKVLLIWGITSILLVAVSIVSTSSMIYNRFKKG
jgi:hypothetical protein